MRRHTLLIIAFIIVLALATAISGCGSSATVTLVLDEQDYSAQDVETLDERVPMPAAAGRPVEDAADIRHEALTDLRSQGEEGSALADLLTESFPGEDRSVPYHVEKALLDERPVWIVLEVWGPDGGSLDFTRTWAFDRESGSVVYSSASN